MLRRWKRYLWFSIQYFLFEKPKGLDFTMRDKSLLKKSNGLYHGYSKTPEKHLKEIFDSLVFTGNDMLLDIGCGKGVVLKTAAGYPFKKVAGIDINAKCISVAVKNFQILGMENQISCWQIDAAGFEHYDEYNVFFLCNPFSGPILEKVADKLLEVSEKKTVTIIYYNPVYIDIFKQKGELTVLRQLYDKTKDYHTCIFQIHPKKG